LNVLILKKNIFVVRRESKNIDREAFRGLRRITSIAVGTPLWRHTLAEFEDDGKPKLGASSPVKKFT